MLRHLFRSLGRHLLVLGGLALGLLSCRASTPEIPVRPPTVHEHNLVTPDGWMLGALHFSPERRQAGPPTPVILCHGTACNTNNMDLVERNSLARALTQAGFDVWAVELRGGPLGHRVSPSGKAYRSHFHARRERGITWDFDSHVEQDVPTLVREIQRRTGRNDIHWIGHSLGGMVAWGAEARGTVSGFRSIVAIGSPGAFGHPTHIATRAPLVLPFLGALNGVPIHATMRLASRMLRLVPPLVAHTLMNPRNMEIEELRLISATMLEDSPKGLIAQYMRWIEQGEIVSRDGTFSYTRALSRVKSPLAVLAGRADGIAPVWAVKPLYLGASSPIKEFRVFGVSEGDRIDYGHLDLVLGRHAPDEVFPWIERWLKEH